MSGDLANEIMAAQGLDEGIGEVVTLKLKQVIGALKWATLPCPICNGRGCRSCWGAGLLPTPGALRKYGDEVRGDAIAFKNMISNINEVLASVAELERDEPELLPDALVTLGVTNLEELRAQALTDRKRYQDSLEQVGKTLENLEGLRNWVRTVIDAKKKLDALRAATPQPTAPLEPAEAIQVQECEECTRPATYFGEDGRGYCKRHAHARGLLEAPDRGVIPEPEPTPEAPDVPARGPTRSFPLIGGPLAGTRAEIEQGEVSVWLVVGGKEYRYDHHGAKYVFTGSEREKENA